jgi:hypothetical protein
MKPIKPFAMPSFLPVAPYFTVRSVLVLTARGNARAALEHTGRAMIAGRALAAAYVIAFGLSQL